MSLTEKLIWTIETRLSSPLSLGGLALDYGLTPHHLSRVFALGAGMSVMSYIRRRRLSQAALQLRTGHRDILQLALDCGYGSHEAFTRAFRACFGVSPSMLRQNPAAYALILTEVLQMNPDMIVPLSAPVLRQHEAFSVVGLMMDSAEPGSSIPALWSRFNACRTDGAGAVSYGVCLPGTRPGTFGYLAGMNGPSAPGDMTRVDLPAGRYAVFTHDGHIADLPKAAYTAWNKILPELGLHPRAAPDFERYDPRFDPDTGRGQVELWIPLSDQAPCPR